MAAKDEVSSQIELLDCTCRDGGYYNAWDFSQDLIESYLSSLAAVGVPRVELGFRSLKSSGFKGACAYTTDRYLSSIAIPDSVQIAVMVNASELNSAEDGVTGALSALFSPADSSLVRIVRLACHAHEVSAVLDGVSWLKDHGYTVCLNLMQIAEQTADEVRNLARAVRRAPLDVLYFADSMGSLDPETTMNIVRVLRSEWNGLLGFHAHNNTGLAVSNSLAAAQAGVTWIDGTVTGMGRGPGNAPTEYLLLEHLGQESVFTGQFATFLRMVNDRFRPLQNQYGWGPNPYYYLSGKLAIHPTYVQEMQTDPRYGEDEILTVLDRLRDGEGKKFSPETLSGARHYYSGRPTGNWRPSDVFQGRDVLVIGPGPSAAEHAPAIETLIEQTRPYVIALNTVDAVRDELIDARAACHPMRLIADWDSHRRFAHPLILPISMLPKDVQDHYGGLQTLDYGTTVTPGTFTFGAYHSSIPVLLVAAYALAVAASGCAARVLLAGFDGYSADDARRAEVDSLLQSFHAADGACPVVSVTPTLYEVPVVSVYSGNFQGGPVQ